MSLYQTITMLYENSAVSVGEIVVDAAIEEIHVRTAKAMEHPVEDGANIADHIVPENIQVQIDGIISNVTTAFIGYQLVKGAVNLWEQKSNDRAQSAFKKLEEIFVKREPIKIVTTLKSYDKMVLENLVARRDAALGDALRFSCSARAVRLVEAKVINIGKHAVVKQPTMKASPVAEKKVKSLLYSFFE